MKTKRIVLVLGAEPGGRPEENCWKRPGPEGGRGSRTFTLTARNDGK